MNLTTSFVIIAYNEERTIGRCIESILAQHGLRDYDIVVVDDGSKDKTSDVVRGYARKNPYIKLNRLPQNQGRGAARAAGVQLALGTYLAFVDADAVLPPNWLSTCLSYMNEYDAVGGIAVPDGDVNFVYCKFNLHPKVVKHTTTITGNNGLYKREIFDVIAFDSSLREGEDVAFNHLMTNGAYKTHSIPDIIVAHREAKTFLVSALWLFQSGLGAARQFKQYKKLRLPDVAFFGSVFILLASVALYMRTHWIPLLFIFPLSIFVTSLIHMHTRFYFHFKQSLSFFGAVLVNSFLIACYYTGRTLGIFNASARNSSVKKKVMVCIDLEGAFGMPFEAAYDLAKAVDNILHVLDKHSVQATFFTVGRLIEERPELVAQIHQRGHEIAIHGYSHTQLSTCTVAELSALENNLARIGAQVLKITNQAPVGFRAPYLMAPAYYTKGLYETLERLGYVWVSNREIRYAEELFRPNRFNAPFLWGTNNWFTSILLVMLNGRLIWSEHIKGRAGLKRILDNLTWLAGDAEPFKRGNLCEIPIYSPLDCDLLGLPKPGSCTDMREIRYATACLVGGVHRSSTHYMITFHDWIIGSDNRIKILDDVLSGLQKTGMVSFVKSGSDMINQV